MWKTSTHKQSISKWRIPIDSYYKTLHEYNNVEEVLFDIDWKRVVRRQLIFHFLRIWVVFEYELSSDNSYSIEKSFKLVKRFYIVVNWVIIYSLWVSKMYSDVHEIRYSHSKTDWLMNYCKSALLGYLLG